MSQKPDLYHYLARLGATVAALAAGACMVGPHYQRPAVPAPPAFKEPPPAGWKEAQPNEGVLRGKWWEIYADPALNALEEQIDVSNQNVLKAEAQFRAARESVRSARTALYPVVSAGTTVTNSRSSAVAGGSVSHPQAHTALDLPLVEFAYQADVWGGIRRSVVANAENAQATAAQLENARLTIQATLALDYFELHGLDGEIDLLENTVKSYDEYLALTRNRFTGGVATGADVAQAETQLHTARAQLTELGVSRATYEHAIAILVGRAPSELSIPRRVLSAPPPPVPVAVPSTLLERRPDIAAAERLMAAQNEQIGIAQAALYPSISFSASGGFQGSNLTNILSMPDRFWSLGPSLMQTVFDAGKRRIVIQQQRELYDASVANYRQTVLTGFQQVEDALSTLRILETESAQVQQTVDAAQRSLDISTAQYKAGVVGYLPVITAQTALLSSQRAALTLLARRMVASVQLIEALGGSWDAARLPSIESLKH
jgi:NodT family efflux transporter outer membrane factor (OMF) lipoprotein